MSTNTLGGIAAIVALATIFYFGTHRDPAPVPEAPPAPTVVKPAPSPPTPTPTKPGKPGKPNPKDPTAIYHRVEQGGKQGPETACVSVKPFADGKSEAELQALAKQYGVTVAVVKTWHVCSQ